MAGRPEFKPTPETRDQVVKLVACRTSEKDIATRFGIDAKTLRKHFREQLDTGFALYNTEVWLKFAESVLAEPTPAKMKFWTEHQDKIAAAGVKDIALEDRATPSLGKKEMKRVEAGQAGVGTVWENLLRPAQSKDVN